MNSNLNEAIFDTAKANALMYAYEKTFLDMEFMPEDLEKADMGVNAFYAIWDMVKKISDDLDRLAGDDMVVDAIYAVNDVRRHSTLKTED